MGDNAWYRIRTCAFLRRRDLKSRALNHSANHAYGMYDPTSRQDTLLYIDVLICFYNSKVSHR